MKFYFLFLSFFFGYATAQTSPFELTAKVVGVSDGDTIKVLDVDNQEFRVRLLHIDAPERGQDFNKKAKEYLASLCFGNEVKIIWQKKDQYQRILAEVFVKEMNLNHEMVKQGYAWHFKKHSDDETYAQLERLAQKQRNGLWQHPNPTPPWDFRKMKKQKRK